jgi:putative flippase GtrA
MVLYYEFFRGHVILKKMVHQISWFVLVGTMAAGVHWMVAVVGVKYMHLNPLWANLIGWLVAFVVSFSGHYHLTFRLQRAGVKQAIRRFFMISACGFAVNELSYAYLLATTHIRFDWLLAGILIGVAGATFVAGRIWGFKA